MQSKKVKNTPLHAQARFDILFARSPKKEIGGSRSLKIGA
jgi:hypothetical protein